MKLLQKKLKNKKGFTLIEMLVVVAIIAILVAISIPMVSGALDKARKAADDANLQAAKSVALLAEMTGTVDGEAGGTAITADVYFYDIKNGVLSNASLPGDGSAGPQSSTTSGNAIIVEFNASKRIIDGPKWGSYS